MKIKLEINDNLAEDEIVIHCRELNEEILKLQQQISHLASQRSQLEATKKDVSYYLATEDILFFETAENYTSVHTTTDIYKTSYKLYELEEMLPMSFMRVSKSTILNIGQILGIRKNLTGPSQIEFRGTDKKAYVSRNYLKLLTEKLSQKR